MVQIESKLTVYFDEPFWVGVFENNPSAYRCYRSVGFRESETDKAEYYRVFDEEWKCLEMELWRTS